MAAASATLSKHCKAQEEARKYLDTHNLERLFTQMINQILFTKPANPKIELILFLAERVPYAQLHENGIFLQGVAGIRKSVMVPITEKFQPTDERKSGFADAVVEDRRSSTGEDLQLDKAAEGAIEAEGNAQTMGRATCAVANEDEDDTQQPDTALDDASKEDDDDTKAAADDGAGADVAGLADGMAEATDTVNEVIELATADEGEDKEEDPVEDDGAEKEDDMHVPQAAVIDDTCGNITAATDEEITETGKVEAVAEDEDKAPDTISALVNSGSKADNDTAEDAENTLDPGSIVESLPAPSRFSDISRETQEEGDARSVEGSSSEHPTKAEKERKNGEQRTSLKKDSVDEDDDKDEDASNDEEKEPSA